jgi:hypothetical protein
MPSRRFHEINGFQKTNRRNPKLTESLPSGMSVSASAILHNVIAHIGMKVDNARLGCENVAKFCRIRRLSFCWANSTTPCDYVP